MKGFWRTIVAVWRLSAPYFVRSADRWRALVLVVAVTALALGAVAVSVRMNTWNRDFFNAMQARDLHAWQVQLVVFGVIGAMQLTIGVGVLYLIQLLEIRWRKWMTSHYVSAWLERSAHYRMQLITAKVDNPDQRISMDIALFVEKTLNMLFGDRSVPGSAGILGAVASLGSFTVILWALSAHMPIPINGVNYIIPGFLVWAALVYSLTTTLVTHVFGRQLINLRFDQQRYEADFRFDLVRVRENSEQIALLRGEEAEKARLMGRFGAVVHNWHHLMTRQVKLGVFTTSFGVLSLILPSLLVAPAFFLGAIGFGELMQISNAFAVVQGAFSFFVVQYRNVAEWKAIVDRLTGFEGAVVASREQASDSKIIQTRTQDGPGELTVKNVELNLPGEVPLIVSDSFKVGAGERVLVTGPTGSGKSTMFRAIGGVWPHGSGEIGVPEGASVMVAPQRPYLPVGTLSAAMCFPSAPDTWSAQQLTEALADVGLSHFSDKLDEHAHWDRRLSLGEQQRIAMARVLLHKPDYLLLDEATSSLDEPSEARLYMLIRERLPETTLISIGHRSALTAFHERRLVVVPDGERSRLVEDTPPTAVAAAAGA